MQKNILMVQFRKGLSEEHEQTCVPDKVVHEHGNIVHFHFMNAFDDACGWNSDPATLLSNFDGVILGGSSDFYFGGNIDEEKETAHNAMVDRVRPFVSYILKNDIPTLGICFGHQMLGYFLGVRVVDDPSQAESGSFSVKLSQDGLSDPLFFGLSETFLSFFVHRDSLEALPKGSVLLASGERCHVGAFRFRRHVYGVQFHPELSLKDIHFRVGLSAKGLEHYIDTSLQEFMNSLQETSHASKILMNFVSRCL